MLLVIWLFVKQVSIIHLLSLIGLSIPARSFVLIVINSVIIWLQVSLVGVVFLSGPDGSCLLMHRLLLLEVLVILGKSLAANSY